MGKLTDVHIRNWVKAGKPVAKADGGGLTFTLSAKGAAAWVLRYRFGGAARELTMGRYPEVSLTEARKLAAENRVKVYQGNDVAREKQRAKVRAATLETFGKLAQDYMGKVFPGLAASTARQRRRHIEPQSKNGAARLDLELELAGWRYAAVYEVRRARVVLYTMYKRAKKK
jgi:hypothetical protein